MPSYAIKSSGIRQVAASRLIGNSTGSTGSAEELSATAAKTLLGLGSSDGPTFASATIGGVSISSVGMITTPTGNGSGTAGGLMLGNSIGWISRGTGSVELASGSAEYIEMASDGITLRTGLSFGWSANNNPQDATGPRLWENTTTERIELRRGTTALGFAVANTWTDASNLEFGVFDFTTTSNVLTIGTESAGTGTQRGVVLAGDSVSLESNAGSHSLYFKNGEFRPTTAKNISFGSSSIPFRRGFFGGDIHIASSGTDTVLDLSATYNQTGSAGSTDILVNRTETAVGSGDQNFIDLQVGGTSKFKVDNDGQISTNGAITQLLMTPTGSFGRWLKLYASGSSPTVDAQDSLSLKADGTTAFTINHGGVDNSYIYTGDVYFNPLASMALGQHDTAIDFLSYNTYTDASNYERGVFEWTTTSNTLTIGAEAAGTGTLRAVDFIGSAFDFNNKTITAGGLTTTGTAVLGNYDFNTAETVGAGQDNYVLTYDNSTGKIGLEAAGGGNPFDQDLNTTDSPTFDDLTTTGDANISNSNTGKLTINGTTYGIKRSGSGFGFLLNNQHRFVMKTDRSAISGVYSGSTPHYFGFTNTTHADTASSAVDVRLQREAANHLAMVNGTNASTFSVSNTFTDASNYERGVLKWDSNILKIGTESAGTGSDRIVQFVGSGVSMPSIPTSDPASAGELWNDSGTLKVSAG